MSLDFKTAAGSYKLLLCLCPDLPAASTNYSLITIVTIKGNCTPNDGGLAKHWNS